MILKSIWSKRLSGLRLLGALCRRHMLPCIHRSTSTSPSQVLTTVTLSTPALFRTCLNSKPTTKRSRCWREFDLQWTVFINGIFLDYFGPLGLKSHLEPDAFVVDMKEPADVALICCDNRRPAVSIFIADSFNRLLTIRGCPFDIHYAGVEKPMRSEITELPRIKPLVACTTPQDGLRLRWVMFIFRLEIPYFLNVRTYCIHTRRTALEK